METQASSMTTSIVDKNNKSKIIFRFTDEKKYRQQAELIASENPENTFIFQVDKNLGTIILEYGKLDNLQKTTIDKWILLGDVQLQDAVFLFEGMTIENLVDVMNNIHKQHLLAIPGEISFFNKRALGRLSNPYDISAIACQLAIKLAQKNITTNITTYQANIDPFPLPSLDGVAEYFDLIKNNKFSKFRYDQATEQLFYNDFNISHALFMDIAKGNIDLDIDFQSYPDYLNQYLLGQDGNLITNRIKTIIYDPIISRKVNNYFLRNINQLSNPLEQWQKIFLIDNNESLNIKVRNIDLLLENISYRPEIIYYLSDYSKNLLAELYSRSDGTLDVASLMILINEPQQLNKLHMSLTELAGIDERSRLSELPLQESLFRSQQWHQYYLNNIITLTRKVNQDPNLTLTTPRFLEVLVSGRIEHIG